MSTQIEIQPDVAHKLSAIAKMRGVSIDTLLRQILKRLDKTDESSPEMWRLGGSIELLDDDLESASWQINKNIQKSLLETARNL